MPIESPNLDDRRYRDIVEEAKRLIPGYTPEWTDWNEHDPGITLMELFAWMTDIILYRQNLVPDKNYIEFLKLIGVELKPATPARTHLTFTISEDAAGPVNIKKGTRVEAEASGDEEPVVFETDETLIAIPSVIKGVQSFDGYGFTNFTEKTTYYPFGKKARKDSALYIGFSGAFPEPETEVSIRVELLGGEDKPRPRFCELKESEIHPPVRLIWEYWKGGWKRLDIVKDETLSFLRSGYIYFKGPSDIEKSNVGLLTEEEDKCFWIRSRIMEPGYEMPPRIEKVLLNTVAATNAVTVKDEIIGSSDGTPDLGFNLRNTPVLSESLLLEVDEGDGWKEWKEVDTLRSSSREETHYTFNRLTGKVSFGNGVDGKIPFAGVNNIKASYRYGGEVNGNVGGGTITSLQSNIPGVEEVTNFKAAEGGEDEETIESAKERAPGELKTRHRAVTSEDFETLAKDTPGMKVARALALPLYHPEFSEELKVPGVVTVVIVPESEEKKPVPSEGMVKTVCAHLGRHRLITTELYVVPPKYKQVKIEAEIVAKNRFDLGEVKKDVVEKLEEYYHPLKGGSDGTGWPFGGEIYFSEAYRVVLAAEGVGRIESLKIYVDDELKPHCEDVEVPGHYLVYSDGHDIRVDYDREER